MSRTMVSKFSSSLLQWYHKHKRDLQWRRTKDHYRIWVSEVMLQQTTVNAVVPFYQRWFEIFPTVKDLASADIQQVLKAWQGLGYYARAKNLHKAAGVVNRLHGGVLPADPQLVRALPGFGPYSTGSVLSIAYDLPLKIIDANVRRVAMRLLALQGHADTKQDKAVEAFLHKVFPQKNAGDFNQALMELGALVCRKEPLCVLCPVSRFCQAFEQGVQMYTTYKKDPNFIGGLMLYWAEGNKQKKFGFTNSDSDMIRIIIKWLREYFSITPKNLTISFNIHSGQNEKQILKFWQKLTHIPLQNFRKNFIKPEGMGYKKNILYNGTARLTILGKGSTYKLFIILGILAAYLEETISKPTNIENWIVKLPHAD